MVGAETDSEAAAETEPETVTDTVSDSESGTVSQNHFTDAPIVVSVYAGG